jgi:hypothetical protein
MTDLPTTDLPARLQSELVALSDGALAGERRERMLAIVRSSPELQAALDEQRRALELTAGAAGARAPAALHRRVEAMLESRTRRARALPLPRLRFAAAAAGLAAAAAAAIVAALSLWGGGSGPLTVQQAAALTLSPATMPAPAESHARRSQLAVSVEGVAFPYWEERFGWRSAGARVDRAGGRAITTVFYADPAGRRIGYTIVSGRAIPTRGGTVAWRAGVPYRLLARAGAVVVAWRRGGHLCVVSGRGVGAATLLRLAGWSGERPVGA